VDGEVNAHLGNPGLNDSHFITAQPQGADMDLMDLKALRDYGNWIGQTAWVVYCSVIAVGGWKRVFPDALPRWASKVRQYFNLAPTTLKLLDHEKSSYYLEQAQCTLPLPARAVARRTLIEAVMGINPVLDLLVKPGPWEKAPEKLGGPSGLVATAFALSGDVYQAGPTPASANGPSFIWFQTSPGGAIFHFGEKIESPKWRAIDADLEGQEHAPVFKLVCPDVTGGSGECCIRNPFDVGRAGRPAGTPMVGHTTIGAVNEVVNVADRIVKDPVSLGSYNYAETTVEGLLAHERLDVSTDPQLDSCPF